MEQPNKDKKDSKDKNKDTKDKHTLTPEETQMAFELRPQQYHSPPTYHYDKK